MTKPTKNVRRTVGKLAGGAGRRAERASEDLAGRVDRLADDLDALVTRLTGEVTGVLHKAAKRTRRVGGLARELAETRVEAKVVNGGAATGGDGAALGRRPEARQPGRARPEASRKAAARAAPVQEQAPVPPEKKRNPAKKRAAKKPPQLNKKAAAKASSRLHAPDPSGEIGRGAGGPGFSSTGKSRRR